MEKKVIHTAVLPVQHHTETTLVQFDISNIDIIKSKNQPTISKSHSGLHFIPVTSC
jgi:hypothetical protein